MSTELMLDEINSVQVAETELQPYEVNIVQGAEAKLRPDEINSVEVVNEIIPSVVRITWSYKKMWFHSGTGVVWNKEGIVTTNYNVIAGADDCDLRVTFADNTTFGKVRVLCCFEDLDFAVLHVDAPRDKLVPIPIGDSANLRCGQKAYAIGYPYECRNSFSGGYISGVDCVVGSPLTGVAIGGLIQTDAFINHGNSGGPLLDSSKKLVGINTYRIPDGVAFAIPGNLAKEIIDLVVQSANGTTPNLASESSPYHFVEWIINRRNSVNANEVCVEASEIVNMAVKSMDDTRPSLGIEFVGQSGGLPNPVNEVCLEVSGSADMMVRSVMDTRPNSRIESPLCDQSVEWSGHITNSSNRWFNDVKLNHCGHCHHDHNDTIRYPFGQPLIVSAFAVTKPKELQPDEKISSQVYEENKLSAVKITWINNSSRKLHYGTGTVWSTEGYIITNYHVIDGARASDLRVTFADKTRCDKVEVILCFRTMDIAVLRVDAPRRKLKPIQVGDSTECRVGQNTYAIGYPFCLENSLTKGVISGTDREIPSPVTGHRIRGVIQTDAAINRGNSGGPLFVSSGEVIGINTCIMPSSSGTSSGVAFTVPVKAVKKVVDMVMSGPNDTSPNLSIQSPPNQSGIWYIDIPNSVNGVCVEVSEIAEMALKAMKDTRPSLGIESAPYHSVEESVDIPNSANGVMVVVSGSANIMVRSVMDTRPNSIIKSPPFDQCDESANEVELSAVWSLLSKL